MENGVGRNLSELFALYDSIKPVKWELWRQYQRSYFGPAQQNLTKKCTVILLQIDDIVPVLGRTYSGQLYGPSPALVL